MDERGGGRSRSSHPSRPWPLLGASLCRPGPGGGGWSLRMPGAPPVPRPQLRLPGVSPPLSPPLGLPVGGSPSRPGPLKWSPARPAGLPTSSSKTRDTAPGGGGHVGPGAWVEWGEGPEARGRWGSWCGQRASPSSPHPCIPASSLSAPENRLFTQGCFLSTYCVPGARQKGSGQAGPLPPCLPIPLKRVPASPTLILPGALGWVSPGDLVGFAHFRGLSCGRAAPPCFGGPWGGQASTASTPGLAFRARAGILVTCTWTRRAGKRGCVNVAQDRRASALFWHVCRITAISHPPHCHRLSACVTLVPPVPSSWLPPEIRPR